ncbi:hypothetical protein AB0N64_03335 [Microbacterium sp. NPDC089318]
MTGIPAFADEGDKPGGLLSAAAKNSKGETTVTGRSHTPGTSASRSDGRANSVREDRSFRPNATIGYTPPQPSPFENCLLDWDRYRGCWQNSIPGEDAEAEAGEEAPALPPITITDLASFSPAKGTVLGEPDNLGVAGLPTNFVTEAETHVRSGELFGFPIDVRFTPVSYTFHYGDEESETTPSPGASWESLGQAQFTPTDTSHSYAERGTYDARVDIAYTAEIDLGVGWFPIDGQLDIPGPTQQIRIFEAHTALVARTCAEQPSAPGC